MERPGPLTRDDLPDVRKEGFYATPLFQALDVAAMFGQEPIGFVRRFERESRGMRATLIEYVRVRAEMDTR